ncbi:unnamed protein product (macronuclear) [Paramecium tetraurelia]|uniref:Uncharacterized protein n=1 Tax=Paramecium tetraurelia TaxID=5888 RepID=A0CP20_PARTE|nr:uncharacterized protein GSPATT00008928001 [Paramecium tetraurelia]CAK72537.1 unnamed protein product [Paramecium tetraurelia]|eukprot:XP_001439934.1 hypothetical protein (macronuclear) [Paramecium tetraurelia strain d4-2]
MQYFHQLLKINQIYGTLFQQILSVKERKQQMIKKNCYLKLTNTKSRIDTSAPWRPSHSLSKCNNKYLNAEENKIVYENNILLNKMVNIQKQGNKSNKSMPQIPKSQQMTKRIQIEKLQQEICNY